MLPPSSPSPDERAAAQRRHAGVLDRARRIRRRRILVPRAATVLVAVSAAIAVPLALGRGTGGLPAGSTTSSSTGPATTVVPPDPVPESFSTTITAPAKVIEVPYELGEGQQFSLTHLMVSYVPVSGYPHPQGTFAVSVFTLAGVPPQSVDVYQVGLAQLAAAGEETVTLSPPVVVGSGWTIGASIDCADEQSHCATVRIEVSGTLTQVPVGTSSTTNPS